MSKDLKNLLKLSVEAQTSNNDAGNSNNTDIGSDRAASTALVATSSAVSSMSEDRRRWLDEALSHLAVDSRQRQVAECIRILETSSSSLSTRLDALETLADLVDDLDVANDFAKMGGFNVLVQCLKNRSEAKQTCIVIGEVAQNNPQCQDQMTSIFLQDLINLLNSELEDDNENKTENGDNDLTLKAMFALSCLSRSNPKAQQVLIENDNLAVLIKALQSDDTSTRLIARVSFFISALCQENDEMASRLTKVGLVSQLIAQLSAQKRLKTNQDEETSVSVVHEHLAKALLTLVQRNNDALEECREDRFGLQELLKSRMEELKDVDESKDEVETYSTLAKLCFE